MIFSISDHCGSEDRQKKRSENQAVINDFGLEESSQHDMKESNSNCIAVLFPQIFLIVFLKSASTVHHMVSKFPEESSQL